MSPTSSDKPKLNTKELKKALMQEGHHDKIENGDKKPELMKLYMKYCMDTPETKKKPPKEIRRTHSSEKRAGIEHQYELSPPNSSPIPQTTNHSIHIDDSFTKDKTEDSAVNDSTALRNEIYIAQQVKASPHRRESSLRPPSVASASTVPSGSRVRRSQSRDVHTTRNIRDSTTRHTRDSRESSRPLPTKPPGVPRPRSRERRSESVLRINTEDTDEHADSQLECVEEEAEGTDEVPTQPHHSPAKRPRATHQSRTVLVTIYTWLCLGLSLVGYGLHQIQTTRSTISICVGRPDGFSPLHGGVCQSEDLKCAAGYVLYDGKCLLHEEKRELEANARNIRLLMASENLFKRLRRHEGFAQCGYTDAPGLYWTGEAHVIKEEFAMESDNLLFRMIEVINGELCPVAPPTAEDSYADALPLHMQRKHVMRPPCVFLEHMDADPYIHVDKALAIISLECRLRRWVRTLSMLMLGVFGVLLSLLVGQIRRKRRARAERETKEALERLLREAKARRLHSNEFYVVIEDFRRDCLKLYEADVVDEAILRARHDARVQTFKMLINGKEQKVLRWLDERQPVKEEVANTSFVQKYKPTPGPKGPIYPTF